MTADPDLTSHVFAPIAHDFGDRILSIFTKFSIGIVGRALANFLGDLCAPTHSAGPVGKIYPNSYVLLPLENVPKPMQNQRIVQDRTIVNFQIGVFEVPILIWKLALRPL